MKDKAYPKIMFKDDAGVYRVMQWKSMTRASKGQQQQALDGVLDGTCKVVQVIMPAYILAPGAED